MSQAKRGLGKGVEGLIPTELINDQLALGETVRNIAVDLIEPNPNQPRQEFRPEALAELAASIKLHGILQPLIVTKHDSKYRLIAGERRLRAAKQAGLRQVPAIVRTINDQQRIELALIENLQRDDLSALETAAAFVGLAEHSNLTYEAIAERVGRSLSSVKNTVRLLALPENAKQALMKGEISEGHARQVLALKNADKQQELLDLIKERGWSVRQAERFAKLYKQSGSQKRQAVATVADTSPITNQWQQRLGAPVKVQRLARELRLVITVKNEAELAKLTDKIFPKK